MATQSRSTREYCLTIEAFGDGDLARLPVDSNQVCATVTQLTTLGGSLEPDDGGTSPDGGTTTDGARVPTLNLGSSGCVAAGAAPGPGALVMVTFVLLLARRRRAR